MKKIILGILFFAVAAGAVNYVRQDGLIVKTDMSVGSNTTPNSKSVLDLVSTTKGMLPPRMSTAQRDAIASPPEGLSVYNTTTDLLSFYTGSAWLQTATLTGTEVLTNKTLTGNTAVNLISGSGTVVFNTSGTMTLPNGTDTVAGITLAQTLTNKTMSGAANTFTNISLATAVTGALPIANGGTGQVTAQAAIDALVPSQGGNNGKVLSTNGTTVSWATSSTTTAPPTIQRYTTGSGTFTVAGGISWLRVRMAGGGGGGGAGANSAASANGGTGGNTTFVSGALTIATNGGAAAAWNGGGGGGTGGTVSVGTGATTVVANAGGNGGGTWPANSESDFEIGGIGGSNAFGGHGIPGAAGAAGGTAIANTGGGGGGGGGANATTSAGGPGGGAGAYAEAIIASPAATYTYAVGAGGAGETGGSSAGGAGAAGIIIIEQYP